MKYQSKWGFSDLSLLRIVNGRMTFSAEFMPESLRLALFKFNVTFLFIIIDVIWLEELEGERIERGLIDGSWMVFISGFA